MTKAQHLSMNVMLAQTYVWRLHQNISHKNTIASTCMYMCHYLEVMIHSSMKTTIDVSRQTRNFFLRYSYIMTKSL